jgi:hypothetical protein
MVIRRPLAALITSQIAALVKERWERGWEQERRPYRKAETTKAPSLKTTKTTRPTE